MQHAAFVVHETPHCVWVPDLDEENRRFLKSINPDYFHYVGSAHMANLKRTERKTDQLAAIALRSTCGTTPVFPSATTAGSSAT